ncbi:MAG: DNA-directed RNA polymerase subunit beta [Propionibacteriaceae bacterium]|nr:DNA-directed RNA polymerase subunit beta [Propionibacteriaceae bacterium]
MAASRTSSKNTKAISKSGRVSFAKIDEPMEVPNLLALQTESYEWLTGSLIGWPWADGADAWKERQDRRFAEGEDVNVRSGLEEVFEEISPIEDFAETMSLSFSRPRFLDPKRNIEECKDRDETYAAQLYVTAEFNNNETGEIKSQTVFMGDFPLMTPKGTFVIAGTERVVVSQLVRSPGVYFEQTPDKTSDRDIFTCKVIPSRGAWLEFEIDKRDTVGVRLDRKRKQNVTVLLKALGWTEARILEEFGEFESIRATLEKDHVTTQDEALVDIFRKMRPGEPPTKDAASSLIENYYFNPKRYDLAKVGRYKINKKLGLSVPSADHILTEVDLVAAIKYICAMHAGLDSIDGKPIETDDIDHFGNRRLRTVGELIQNQLRTGLSRMERVVRDRMTTQDIEAITPMSLVNIRPVTAALKEFFGTSQLSQFMDQNNPLAELTHKRRLSALGPGGLSRDRAGMEVRDVHTSHYGRMCPIETPEGPNIGLIGCLASFAKVNSFGFIETPYRKVIDGRVTDQIDYLSADEEDRYVIAQANAKMDDKGKFTEDGVLVRMKHGDVDTVPPANVDYMDVSPRQMVSVATALIPFLEHDDASRALMGANMQRQAVPLLRNEAPYVGTGMEYRAAVDVGDVTLAAKPGTVVAVTADYIDMAYDDGTYVTHRLDKFVRSNAGTCVNQRPMVVAGQHVETRQPLADGPCTDQGELALGRNLLVAFMPWEGLNYEDAIILSQRVVQDDLLTSIHIEEHEVDARDTKLGAEEITRDIPNISDDMLANLDERGVIRVGAEVTTGDILVGKVTPKGETELTPEERLLRAIFGEKAREVRDTSLKVPHGESGTIIGVRVFEAKKPDGSEGDDLPAGVNQLVRVYVASKRKVQEGDKLAGRHGNKGVISKILPLEDMPFLPDGTPVDIVLNPLGVPSRMNVGQVLENHLGWIAHSGWDISDVDDEWAQHLRSVGLEYVAPDTNLATPVFDGATENEIGGLLAHGLPNRDGERMVDGDGKAQLFDGRSGEPYPERVGVGYMYMLKLHHLVDDKIHARSTGPYSMITQQPLGGKAQFGGQRFGEMEVWALEAYGAAWALQEMLTVKSDDTAGRVKVYEAIVKGENIPDPGTPESFKVLLKEMKSLCLNVDVLDETGTVVELKETEDDYRSAGEEFGIGRRPGSDSYPAFDDM